MTPLTKRIIETLLDQGADLVGIAPVERFANSAPLRFIGPFQPSTEQRPCRIDPISCIIDIAGGRVSKNHFHILRVGRPHCEKQAWCGASWSEEFAGSQATGVCEIVPLDLMRCPDSG